MDDVNELLADNAVESDETAEEFEQEEVVEEQAEESSEVSEEAASLPLEEIIQSSSQPDNNEALLQRDIAELKQQLQQVTQQQNRPFIDVDYDKINSYLSDKVEQVETLRLEGRTLEAMRLQKEINKLIDSVEQNEASKQEWQSQQQQFQQQREQEQRLNQDLNQAAKLFQQHHNIPEDVWNAGEMFFEQARRKDPLLNAKYQEKIMKQGVIEAMDWAFKYVQENIPKAEAPKKPTAPTPGSAAQPAGINLNKLLETARKTGRAEDFIAYRQAKAKLRTQT